MAGFILTEFDQNTTIKKLYVSEHSGYKAEQLVRACKNDANVKELDLGFTGMNDSGAVFMAAVLEQNATLKTLILNSNKIRAEGAKAIAAALKSNTTLQTLNLYRNSIGYEGARAIADALKINTSMQTLQFHDNNMEMREHGPLPTA